MTLFSGKNIPPIQEFMVSHLLKHRTFMRIMYYRNWSRNKTYEVVDGILFVPVDEEGLLRIWEDGTMHYIKQI